MPPEKDILHKDHDLLQRYLDGELDEGQSAELERRLAEDAALQAEKDQLRSLSQAFDQYASQQKKQVPSSQLWAAIERGIAEAAEASVVSSPASVQDKSFFLQRVQRWFWVPFLGVSTAAAAALLLFLSSQSTTPDSAGRGLHSTPQESNDLATIASKVAPLARSEVTAVDFGTNTGMVFDVDEGDAQSAILWIEEPASTTESGEGASGTGSVQSEKR